MALLLLGILIMAHEAGHYFAARACGIEVQEFSMGMGPLLFGKKGKNGTQFSIRALPIGGFCQFYSEDEASDDPRAFNNQAVWKRLLTVVSGPLMNFVVALLVIVIYLSAIGVENVVPRVASVEPNAQQAGLMPGDVLLTIDGLEITDTTVVTDELAARAGGGIVFTVRRGGEEVSVPITPFYDEQAQRYRAGFTFALERERLPLTRSIPISFEYNAESATLIVKTLKNLVTRGEGINDVTGPVGTVVVIEEATREGGLDMYLELIALISVNLGIMNLLPIPGLDGSRLLFLVVEAIRRKPVRRELEGAIHMAGFALLMGLMVLLTYRDIMQFFVK